MGGVIDTSVIAACERKGWSVRQTISHLQQVSDEEVVLPSIAATELIHGIYRARSPEHASLRKTFVVEIFAAWPPMPFTEETAWIAGKLRGEQSRLGNTLPLADSLIAATSLQLSFGVLTLNPTDFTRIPAVFVVPFARP